MATKKEAESRAIEEAYVIERAELRVKALRMFGLCAAMYHGSEPKAPNEARETWRRRMDEALAIVRAAERL
jgi:hypothetical protein